MANFYLKEQEMEYFNKAGLLQFIDMSIKQGLINPNTGGGMKAAVNKILEAVGADEDVRQLDIKSEVLRYNNRHPGALAPDSLAQYEKRIVQAISHYQNYNADPTKFKPVGRAPTTAKKEKSAPTAATPKVAAADPPPASKSISSGSVTETSMALPYPLRTGFFAQVVIPHDMTKNEADRLCAFIQTLVSPPAVLTLPAAMPDAGELSE